METPACPWVSADDTAPWGLATVPYAVTASPAFVRSEIRTCSCFAAHARNESTNSAIVQPLRAV